MFAYRNAQRILVTHSFESDTSANATASDASLEITDKITGTTIVAPTLVSDASGRAIAIFQRNALPLGIYEFAWSSNELNAYDIKTVEVVGFPYFTLRSLRETPAAEFIDDESVFEQTRALVEHRLESIIGRAFRPTRKKETLTLGKFAAEPSEIDVREVLSATVDGASIDVSITGSGMITIDDASLARKRGGLLTVDYVYGADMNSDIQRACLLMAEDVLKNAPSNVTSRTLEGGVFERFVVGGVGNALTSIPEVNEIIERYRRRF